MLATLDATGIIKRRLLDFLADLETEFKAIYGNDLDLNQDTPDGQLIGIFAKAQSDIEELAVSIYNAFDIDTAVATQLDRLIKLNGLIRKPSTKSTVDVSITADRILTLPIGYKIKDTNGQNWTLISATTTIIGVTTATFEAEAFGAINALPNTVNAPVDIVLGVTSLNNTLAATVGNDEESDSAVRQRQAVSTELPSLSSVGGIRASLLNIADVVEAKVYENDTSVYDAVRAMDAHSIWCVVDGGDVNEIASVISKKKTTGTPLKGVVSVTLLETIGDVIQPAIIKFDRPTMIPLYVRLDVQKVNPTDTIDIALIKQKLIEQVFKINANVLATQLYAPIYSAGTNFIASNLEISNDGLAWVSTNLTSGYDERFEILTANVTITELP